MTEVWSVPSQPEGPSYYSSHSIKRSPSSQSFFLNSPAYSPPSLSSPPKQSSYNPSILKPSKAQVPHTDPRDRPSISSNASSSLSLDVTAENEEEDQIVFPTYDDVGYFDQAEELEVPPSPSTGNSYTVSSASNTASTTSNVSRPGSPGSRPRPEDDIAAQRQPTRHVDYLSHDWKEEDIWSSWRHIVSKRKIYGNSARLENASWRTWAKAKNKLRTISPETLNWLKDCDVTWLYGPLQTGDSKAFLPHQSPADSRLSRSNSFTDKKPILKKRSASEIMLQKSISASSLLKQATDAVQAQQTAGDRIILPRPTSDFVSYPFPSAAGSADSSNGSLSMSSSGLVTPGTSERRHIHFNDKVEQCIAVDMKGHDEEEEEEEGDFNAIDDESSSDDGVVMMKGSARHRGRASAGSTPRNSFSNENKTIAMLPSTTLKYRGDTPEPQEPKQGLSHAFWSSGKMSPSPSQETLRPSKPSRNFILDEDDDDEADLGWEPSSVYLNRGDPRLELGQTSPGGDESRLQEGLRRTPSGMFMPIEEDEDDLVAAGLFGKAVDTVNTFKDIAHVIWNVGWRR